MNRRFASLGASALFHCCGSGARALRRGPGLPLLNASPTQSFCVPGGDGELIAAIKERRWRELGRLGPRERALCAIAEKLSATASRVALEDWEALRSLGFDEMGCLEVTRFSTT